MSLKAQLENIVNCDVDAIVNAANTSLLPGSGVCGAIFTAANSKALAEECSELAPIKTGEAVITKGYGLKASYIIHTPGPIYQGGTENEEELLRNCYMNSLELAREYELSSIAFPLISSGVYGYPVEDAMKIAVETIESFLEDNDMEVIIAVLEPKIYDQLERLVY